MLTYNIKKYILSLVDISWIFLVLNQYRIWNIFGLYSNEYGKTDIPAALAFFTFSIVLIIIPIVTIHGMWVRSDNITIPDILIHSILTYLLIISFFGISTRYRVFIWNNTGNEVTIKVEEGEIFPDPNYPTSKIEDGGNYIINTTEQKGDHFTLTVSQSGTKWNIHDIYESYQKRLFDISDGLRIDYFIEPHGEIKKEYWY